MDPIASKYAALLTRAKNSPGPIVLVNGCTHGHERVGAEVVRKLESISLKKGTVLTNIANEGAFEKDVPFIESDLNRVFPGNPDGTHEERIAHHMTPLIKHVDLVIDIHSTETTSVGEDSSIIVTKLDEATLAHITTINPPRALVMAHTAHNALISAARVGIGFEYGRDKEPATLDTLMHDICHLLASLGIIDTESLPTTKTTSKTKFYEVTHAIEKPEGYILNEQIENFRHVPSGTVIASKGNEVLRATEDFYPILFGKNRYKSIFGFSAQKINNPEEYARRGRAGHILLP